MKPAFIILAAGKGTRMESDLAKVLHPLCGRPLLAWVLETARTLEPQRVVAVVGHQAEAVKDAVRPDFPNTEFALQTEMLGTGHAVQQAQIVLSNFDGDIIVTCGDAPLVSAVTFRALVETRREADAAASMLVATIENPGSYGRVIRSADKRVSKIVEAKDATDEERACRDVNAGTYCFRSDALWRHLARIGNTNKSGEFYLTDVIGLLNEAGETVVSVDVSEREMTGINTRAELMALEAELKAEGQTPASAAPPSETQTNVPTDIADAPGKSATGYSPSLDGPYPPTKNSLIENIGSTLASLGTRQAETTLHTLKIFTGSANPKLAQDIADCLHRPLGKMISTRFADGEIRCAIDESIRGADVFIVQPTCAPVNDTLMEMMILCDAFKRASARRIVPIMPYFGYARQDKKVRPREPITAKLVADLITHAGADRIFAIDLHAGQIQGFFDCPVDHLPAQPIIAEYLITNKIYDRGVTIVSPDVGGVERATIMAERLGANLAIVAKRRPEPGKVKVIDVIGDVDGKICVLIDDLIDSGGSITAAANELADRGAREIYACCTHPVLSGDAVRRIEDSSIKELIVTDTIPIPRERMIPKITVLSVAKVCAEAIVRIHNDDSVSTMFESFW